MFIDSLDIVRWSTQWYGLCIYVFVIGLCVGSFLNVVIYRLPVMLAKDWQQQALDYLEWDIRPPHHPSKPFNLALPASSCPHCGSGIKAWQNIPVFSFLFLRGQCANCHVPISWRYPLVELFTGLVSALLFIELGLSLQCLVLIGFTFCLIALAGIDYDHQLLPDSITLPLMWAGLLLNTQFVFVSLHDAVIGAMLGYGVLFLVFYLFKLLTGKDGMGFGDFKLMACFGAWFGWQHLPAIIFLSSFVGAVVGVLLIVMKRQTKEKPIPFGPYIAIAGWLVVVYPDIFSMHRYVSKVLY